MNYRHAFHAGNPADVMKHALLCLALDYLHQKDTPLFMLDTHAAIAQYDLWDGPAQKTGEYQRGIAALYNRPDLPPALSPYIAAQRAINHNGPLRYYAGSPALMRRALRPQDRLVLCELHKDDVETLRGWSGVTHNIRVVHDDAYRALKALMPPAERRGLILIDPAFEARDECDRLFTALTAALRRFASGVYMIWYPIKTGHLALDHFHSQMDALAFEKCVRLDYLFEPNPAMPGLRGGGLYVINPPFTLGAQWAEIEPYLRAAIV